MANILYLSYDGMTDPLGASQVLAYLIPLAGHDHRISLISFEKPERTAAERAAVAERCAAAGIEWHACTYTKRPPILSTLRDLTVMRRLALRLLATTPFDIVHCRSYPPALVGQAVQARGARLLFDMRGFWADERAEAGIWNLRNPLFAAVYRYFKRREAELLRRADHIVSLTEAGRETISKWRAGERQPPVTVIPCCIDANCFPPVTEERRRLARSALGISSTARVAVALGALTGWYRLDRMMALFAEQRRRDPTARFLFVTRDDPALIFRSAEAANVPAEALLIRSAHPKDVPDLVAAADYGLLFGTAGTSPLARSPVKLGEYMAMELPVITDRVIGDVGKIISESGAGVLVDQFDAAGYREALDAIERLTPDMTRWREEFCRWFDLAQGVERYTDIYQALSR